MILYNSRIYNDVYNSPVMKTGYRKTPVFGC